MKFHLVFLITVLIFLNMSCSKEKEKISIIEEESLELFNSEDDNSLQETSSFDEEERSNRLPWPLVLSLALEEAQSITKSKSAISCARLAFSSRQSRAPQWIKASIALLFTEPSEIRSQN